jgi:hypothetical protein
LFFWTVWGRTCGQIHGGQSGPEQRASAGGHPQPKHRENHTRDVPRTFGPGCHNRDPGPRPVAATRNVGERRNHITATRKPRLGALKGPPPHRCVRCDPPVSKRSTGCNTSSVQTRQTPRRRRRPEPRKRTPSTLRSILHSQTGCRTPPSIPTRPLVNPGPAITWGCWMTCENSEFRHEPNLAEFKNCQ